MEIKCFIVLRPSKLIDCTMHFERRVKGGNIDKKRWLGGNLENSKGQIEVRWPFSPDNPSHGFKTLVTGKFCN